MFCELYAWHEPLVFLAFFIFFRNFDENLLILLAQIEYGSVVRLAILAVVRVQICPLKVADRMVEDVRGKKLATFDTSRQQLH